MIKKILVPVDLEHSATHGEILRVASMIANSEGARVVLMTVVEPMPVEVSQFLPRRYEKQLAQSSTTELEKLAGRMDVSSGSVDTTTRFGSVYREILSYAETIGADLIVMGSHEPSVGDYLLGSNASRVVRHSTCSVHIIRMPDAT